jgi:hypothetical protein
VADDEYGAVSQYNAFHTVLKLFFYGLLSLLPADPGTPLYLVTGAAAADDAFAAMTSGAAGTLHLTHRGARAVTVAELVEIAWERFSLDDDFRRKRLLRPLYCDVETFTALVDGAEAFAGPTLRQSVAAMAPFARQLYVRKELSTTQAERALGTPRTGADPRTAARAAIDYAVSTRWGRRAVA